MHTGCIPQEKQLSLYIDERLDKTAQEAFEAHMASCDECRSAVDATQSLRASTALRPAPKAPAFLMDRVMAEIQRQSQAQAEIESSSPITTPQAGFGGWLQGLLPSLRIAAPISSGIAACLLIWSFTSTPAPAPQAKAQVTQSVASAPSTSEQMLFGGEDTTSTKQLVRDIWDVDDDALTTRGG